jgi:hypothetical protein
LAPGGVVAPAIDLLKWDDALQNGRVLLPQTFAQMLVADPVATAANGTNTGMGLFVTPDYYGANGDLPTQAASADRYFADGYNVVLLANSQTLDPPAYDRNNATIAIHNVLNPSHPIAPLPQLAPNPALPPLPASICSPVSG